jgi:hypothetical protein
MPLHGHPPAPPRHPLTAPCRPTLPTQAPDQLEDQREFQVSNTVAEAMGGVHQFESTHCLSLQNMGVEYIQQRSALVSSLLDYGSRLGLRDEIVHDAVLLMDRTVSSAAGVTRDVIPLIVAAALRIACAQSGDAPEALPSDADMAHLLELPLEEVLQMEWNVSGGRQRHCLAERRRPQQLPAACRAAGRACRRGSGPWPVHALRPGRRRVLSSGAAVVQVRNVLGEDTAAISTMRCLKIYLERLGYRWAPAAAAGAGAACCWCRLLLAPHTRRGPAQPAGTL